MILGKWWRKIAWWWLSEVMPGKYFIMLLVLYDQKHKLIGVGTNPVWFCCLLMRESYLVPCNAIFIILLSHKIIYIPLSVFLFVYAIPHWGIYQFLQLSAIFVFSLLSRHILMLLVDQTLLPLIWVVWGKVRYGSMGTT